MEFKKINIISKYKIEIEIGDEYNTKLEVISKNNKKLKTFVNGIQRDLEPEIEEQLLDYIEENINQEELKSVIVNEDFDTIYSKLNTFDILTGYHNNLELAKKRISEDIEYFINTEEYEKCEILKKHLDKINQVNFE